MTKTAVILQSNYIPWKGYFDLINRADVLVVYDIVQYTKNDWRNRNKIMTNNGPEWLTIPVFHSTTQTIVQTQVSDRLWWKKHFKTLQQNYAKAPFFQYYRDDFAAQYLALEDELFLSNINLAFIRLINRLLEIDTPMIQAEELDYRGGQSERLVNICQQLGADRYLSGPVAKNYIDGSLFTDNQIELLWQDYSGYPTYPQGGPAFDHGVSIVDMLFNLGPQAAASLHAMAQ